MFLSERLKQLLCEDHLTWKLSKSKRGMKLTAEGVADWFETNTEKL
jgi:hypothetical protein